MKVDAIINNRKAEVELISKNKNHYNIKIDGKLYDFDIITAGNGLYSILYNNNSWNIEVTKASELNTYTVYKFGQSFKVEIEDALSKSKKNKDIGSHNGLNNIIAPMPGKIVKVFVREGQKVKVGEIVLIISAMKMESEFKSLIDGVVKKVHINDNDIVNGNQLLVEIKAIKEEIEETVEKE